MSSAANTPLIKVMLVEDHLAFRQALAYLLSDHPELEVAAQAASVAEAREVLDGGDLDGGLDVAVLDLALPDGDGRDLIGDLRRSSPGIRIMVLSATIWYEHVEDVLRAGADEVRDKITSYWSLAEEVRRLGGGR
jgi:DNA-binding NarL/FixJ family response regulator